MSKRTLLCGIHFLCMMAALVVGGCGKPDAQHDNSRHYHNVYAAELSHLNYLVSSTVAEMTVAINTVSALVEHDPLGVLKSSAAESWTISDDGLRYTFKLRPGQKWLTWDRQQYGELVAQDFVDAMRYVLDPSNGSFSAHHIRGTIRNADAYFRAKADAASPDQPDFAEVGIRALGPYELQYELEAPTPWFLAMLTHPVYRPVNGRFLTETGDRFGTDHRTLLYCGAYILTRFEPQHRRVFDKNSAYWDQANVHIDRLSYRFNREAATLAPELFYRREISAADIPIAIIDGWMRDSTRKPLLLPKPVNAWNFFFSFNFDPRFAAAYEPQNWRNAVHNINFRKALYHGLDRVAANLTVDPFNPQRQLKNTLTSPQFIAVDGIDYTLLPPLAKFTRTDTFNPELAQTYAARARQELAGTVHFPVKIKWPFNTGSSDAAQRAQVIEQQLETLLGSDFIDFIAVGYPPSGFLDSTRRNGNYALAEVNWGATYQDPYAYTPPFHRGNPMAFSDIASVGGDAYYELLDTANAERLDLRKRLLLLAEAEAYLLENAFLIPYRSGGGGYGVSHIEPFTTAFAIAGLDELSFKYAVLRPTAFTASDFQALEQKWQHDRRRVATPTER